MARRPDRADNKAIMLRLALYAMPLLCLSPGISAEGDVLSHGCTLCHGAGGIATSMPDISTLTPAKIADKLHGFRDKTEDGTVMPHIAAGLTAAEIDALAKHFGARQP